MRFSDVYPGVDVVYYGIEGRAEFDLELQPGADLSQVGMVFSGADSVRLNAEGDLLVAIGGAEIRQHKPRVFQGGAELESWYEIAGGVVRVRVPQAVSTEKLIVDPIVDFSTYLGGPGADSFSKVAVATDGNLILFGSTQSPAAPALDPFQQPSVVFLAPIVLKMSADGRRILFYTILGRNGWDVGMAMKLAKDDSIVLGGTTRSGDFPLKNPFQREFKSDIQMAFVARLTGDGRSLAYSSYMGGAHYEDLRDVALDEKGNSYFVGSTDGRGFPMMLPLQAKEANNQDSYITKVSPEGKLLFSTYYGGSTGWDVFNSVTWRSDGMLVLTGAATSTDFPLRDPGQPDMTPKSGWCSSVLTLIKDDGSAVVYSSYIGGPAISFASQSTVDSQGRIYVVGSAQDRALRLKNPLFTADGSSGSFLFLFDPSGKDLLYSTFLPGTSATSLVLDSDGNIYIGGNASSSDFPLKDSFQAYRGGGVARSDAMLMKISADGRILLFSTLLGGSNGDFQSGLAVGPNRTVYASGQALSVDFPVKNAYQPESGGGGDGMLYRITDDSVAPSATSFKVSPGRLTFRYVKGETAPASAEIGITDLTGQVFAMVSDNWLRVTPAGLGVSGKMSVSVDASALAPGVYQGMIRLAPSAGDVVTVGVTFTVLATAPVLRSVEPGRIDVGTDDTEITLRGSGFTSKTSVQLNTVPWMLSPVSFVDAGTLRFTLPKLYFSGETNHSITVQNPDSAASAPVPLTVGPPAPAIAANGIVNAASYAGGVLSPGEMLTIFGENLEPGMRVNFDGLLATPIYVTPKQLGVVAPSLLSNARDVNVIVQRDIEWRSTPVRMPVWPARPGLFTADSSGRGAAAALNEDGSVNAPGNPAAKGSIVVLWGTGGGVESLPQKVFIDGIESEVLYAAGKDGLWQLNVRIPEFASRGEVVWRAGERESAEGVSVALRD